jgi:hypothetical protein
MPVMVVFPVVMPWLPMRVMLLDPFRVLVEPPVTVAPVMMVIPVAIFDTPLAMVFGPFGMMLPEPSRMVIVPPVGVVPSVMFVEVASFTMFVGAHALTSPLRPPRLRISPFLEIDRTGRICGIH